MFWEQGDTGRSQLLRVLFVIGNTGLCLWLGSSGFKDGILGVYDVHLTLYNYNSIEMK